MDSSKLFKKNTTSLDIEKIKEPQSGILTFFSKKSKKEVVDYTLYKSDLIVALSDSYILIYDIIRDCQKLEIPDLAKLGQNIIQIGILSQYNNYISNDLLICLCKNNLFFINFNNQDIQLNLELKNISQQFYIDFSGETYKFLIHQKYSICIYELTREVKFSKVFEFISSEGIMTKNLVFCDSLLIYETKSKINVLNLNFNEATNKFFSMNKKDLQFLKKEIPEMNKINDTKEILIRYSKLCKSIYLSVNNKIFVLKDCYSEIFLEDYELLDKVTLPGDTYEIILEDPYICVFFTNKVYVYSILDLHKSIEIIELSSNYFYYNFSIIYKKDIYLFQKLNKLNWEKNIIQYSDLIHISRIKYLNQNEFEFLINSCQFMFVLYDCKNNQLEWIYCSSLDSQLARLKRINISFASKYLSYLDYTNEKFTENQNYFLKLKLEIFCQLISCGDYNKSKIFSEESEIDYIFLILLFKNFLSSKILLSLIYYILKSQYANKKDIPINDQIDKIDDGIDEIVSSSILKSEKELSSFLKTFMNRMICSRNDIKASLDKNKRKKINFEKITEILENDSKDINNFEALELKFSLEEIQEKELRYCLLENFIFLCNYYSLKLGGSSKFSDNIKLMIKSSHNLLDKELINLLKQSNLEEDVLLFYYYKGNYTKCIHNIISIYERLVQSSQSSQSSGDSASSSNTDEESYKSYKEIEDTKEISPSIEKIKSQWLSRYINLISLISENLSQNDYYEYLKWALSKNPFKTIEILFEINKLSKSNLDLEFINLLKLFGIDPVIFYLKIFLKNNEDSNTMHHNEMINLYTIKLKLLQEALEREVENSEKNSAKNSLFYKWTKKIVKTREEFCNYLICQNLYNYDFALEKIINLPYLELEQGIVLIKQNKIEEGVYKIFFGEFPTKMKILNLILTHCAYYELVYLLLKYILAYYKKGKSQLYKILSLSEEVQLEVVIVGLFENFNKNYDLIEKLVSLEILDEIQSEKLSEFFAKVLSNLDGESKNYKIESSLLYSKYLSTLNDQSELEKTKIIVDNKSSCLLCNRGFFNSDFVYIYPDKVLHTECFNKYNINN